MNSYLFTPPQSGFINNQNVSRFPNSQPPNQNNQATGPRFSSLQSPVMYDHHLPINPFFSNSQSTSLNDQSANIRFPTHHPPTLNNQSSVISFPNSQTPAFNEQLNRPSFPNAQQSLPTNQLTFNSFSQDNRNNQCENKQNNANFFCNDRRTNIPYNNSADQKWMKPPSIPIFPMTVPPPPNFLNEPKVFSQQDKHWMPPAFSEKESQLYNQNVPLNPIQSNFNVCSQLIDENKPSTFLPTSNNPEANSSVKFENNSYEDVDTKIEWLAKWIETKKSKTITEKVKPNVTLSQMKSLLQESLQLMEQMKQILQVLNSDIKEHTVWQFEYRRALKVKKELEKIHVTLADKAILEHLSIKMAKIRKKRERLKRQQLAVNEEKLLAYQRRNEINENIDRWQNGLLEKHKTIIREKQLKAEADETLEEVRRKNAEAQKMLELLKALRKLRNIRMESASKLGLYTSRESDLYFETSITELETLLNKQKLVYESEQKTMEVMVETAQEENREKEEEQQWEKQNEKITLWQENITKCLFGEEEILPEFHPLHLFRQHYLQGEHFVDRFICIRKEWDAFLVTPDVQGASKIPSAWLMPTEPSSEVWASALKT